MAQTWSSVSLRLHCVSSGTNSFAEEQRTLMRRYKNHSSFTTGLTASCSFHRWEPICKLNFFLSFAFLCLKSLGLHSCAYLFKPFLFPRSEILPMCEIVLQVLQRSFVRRRELSMTSEELRTQKSTPLPRLGVLGNTDPAKGLQNIECHDSVHIRNRLHHLYKLADAG
jgi:hypothetical protein